MLAYLAAVTAMVVAIPMGAARAQTPGALPTSGRQPLASFLRRYLAEPNAQPDSTARFTAARLPIVGDEPGAVVYVSGRAWCGTGGCLLLVLAPTLTSASGSREAASTIRRWRC